MQSDEHGWLAGLASTSDGDTEVTFPSFLSQRRVGSIPTGSQPVPTKLLMPRATPELQRSAADMTGLGEVSEAALLHNLFLRYCQDEVYTTIGNILVSVNPYKSVPLYGPEAYEMYRAGSAIKSSESDTSTSEEGSTAQAAVPAGRRDSLSRKEVAALPPHLFSLSEAAYTELVQTHRDQALIMSGESGAGKTEAAKLAMRYLTDRTLGQGGEAATIARRVTQVI